MTGFSVFLQHIEAFLGTSAQHARHNHFTNEYSIFWSEVLTNYWQLVPQCIPLQWMPVKI